MNTLLGVSSITIRVSQMPAIHGPVTGTAPVLCCTTIAERSARAYGRCAFGKIHDVCAIIKMKTKSAQKWELRK